MRVWVGGLLFAASALGGCKIGNCTTPDSKCEGDVLHTCIQSTRGTSRLGGLWSSGFDCREVGAVCTAGEWRHVCAHEALDCEPGVQTICVDGNVARCAEGSTPTHHDHRCDDGLQCVVAPPLEDGGVPFAYCPRDDTPCDEEGAETCEQPGESSAYTICRGGVLGRTGRCPAGTTCYARDGGAACLYSDDPCEDGQWRCDGDFVLRCEDGRYALREGCEGSFGPSELATCVDGGGEEPLCVYAPGDCQDGETTCAGFRIATCRDGAYTELALCPSETRCEEGSPGAASCEPRQ